MTKFSSKKDVSRAKLVKTVCVGEGKQMVRKFCEFSGTFFSYFHTKAKYSEVLSKTGSSKGCSFLSTVSYQAKKDRAH